ncbi:MAG: hypothetical protein C0598_09945 [Marinilabiliales bacterium]|nr:MAG: hypothetical protein C0598_09945 [Marinilabiliales bacterium]
MDNIRELMLRSLDDDLSLEEKEILNGELDKCSSLRTELEDYKSIRKHLKQYNHTFSENFNKKLFDKIKPTFDLFGSFKSIAISSAIAILMLIASIYIMDGSISINSLIGVNSYPIEEEFYSFLNY